MNDPMHRRLQDIDRSSQEALAHAQSAMDQAARQLLSLAQARADLCTAQRQPRAANERRVRPPSSADLRSCRVPGVAEPLMVFDTRFGSHELAVAVVESQDGVQAMHQEGRRTLAVLAQHAHSRYPGGTSHLMPVTRDDAPRRRVLQILRLLTGGPVVEPWARTSAIAFVCQGMACYRLVLKVLAPR